MSNRTEHHDKIQQITAKLIELNSNFANAPQLSALDIELLRKYAVNLYDEILLLQPAKEATVKPIAPKLQPKAMPVVKQEIKVIPTPEAKVETAPEPVIKEEVIPQQVEKNDTPPTPPVVEEVKQPEFKVEASPTPIEEPKPIEVETPKTPETKPAVEEKKEDLTKEKDNSLNNSHLKPEGGDLASKLGQTPIHDLKKAISINKKFEFISQLFEGDHEGYTKSIHYLNGLSNKDEAMTFFNSLKTENNWDDENKLYLEFANLVSRRFM